MDMLKSLLKFFAFIGILFFMVFSCVHCSLEIDKESYNNGKCTECKNGNYELFDIEEPNYYYYKCDKCEHIIRLTTHMK